MVEYLVVALPHPSGGWVATLPDFVGVTGRAVDMDRAIERAAVAAREVCGIVVEVRKAMPEPCALAEAQKNHRWAKEYGIDWEQAVVRSVALPYPDGRERRRRAERRPSKVAEWARRTQRRPILDVPLMPQAE
jgi:predicted RNase H-like HicB family nuclease